MMKKHLLCFVFLTLVVLSTQTPNKKKDQSGRHRDFPPEKHYGVQVSGANVPYLLHLGMLAIPVLLANYL